eukprot:gene50841-41039_t
MVKKSDGSTFDGSSELSPLDIWQLNNKYGCAQTGTAQCDEPPPCADQASPTECAAVNNCRWDDGGRVAAGPVGCADCADLGHGSLVDGWALWGGGPTCADLDRMTFTFNGVQEDFNCDTTRTGTGGHAAAAV